MILPQHESKWGDGPKQARRMASVLEIQDLHVSYRSREGVMCPALKGVSFALMPGEILGVLGESGSGKSTLAVSLVRLLPGNGEITRGAVHFEGKELLQAKRKELQQIRGRRISLIFQEPSLALHPTMRAGEQVRQRAWLDGAQGTALGKSGKCAGHGFVAVPYAWPAAAPSLRSGQPRE